MVDLMAVMLVEKKEVDWQRALDFLAEAGVCFDGFKDSQAFWFFYCY